LKRWKLSRRGFIKGLAAASALEVKRLEASVLPEFGDKAGERAAGLEPGKYSPGRIENLYSKFLPGEKEAFAKPPLAQEFLSGGRVSAASGGKIATLQAGQVLDGWKLLVVVNINGTDTAVFEKRGAHRGVIAYVTRSEGAIALVPLSIGLLCNITPRPTHTPHNVRFERARHYVPGPDVPGGYILNSAEDPCYENVAAMGAEYVGWAFAGNEDAGPKGSIFLGVDGLSRQMKAGPELAWAPDLAGQLAIDPTSLIPTGDVHIYDYVPGYSKRTLIGGYLPAADVGVWNPTYKAGYECMVVVPPGEDAQPIARVRFVGVEAVDEGDETAAQEHYIHGDAGAFFSALAGVWNRWHDFYEDTMPVDIPDPWLLDAARAGITLSRASYRGLRPTYQIGEGAYTKVPERSHALFPVAHYEFVWAQQLWGLSDAVEPYFQFYLDNYVLPDGNFLYNTQDQVEGPLNVGIFLANAARGYDYTGDADAYLKKLPTLERTLAWLLKRYEYGKTKFPASDTRHGLIWGSPEADLGDPQNDYPESHPYYYQNAAWAWRGLNEHARALSLVGQATGKNDLVDRGRKYEAVAAEMRTLIERSLQQTIAAGNEAMRSAGITPFSPDDTHRKPTDLSSYENHRFMMDWFTADWGVAALDQGHLKHRRLAGLEIMGLHTDGDVARTSNFMDHGTLAARIREDDYRPFLLTLYALTCYAADSGCRYAPEDAYVPGSFPGEGSPYGWSAVVNSVLQPTLGLRWLLCYEEGNRDLCHLQKAAPKHWFATGEQIRVQRCPTRFGPIGWTTRATGNRSWQVKLELPEEFRGDLLVHIHPPDGQGLKQATAGAIQADAVLLTRQDLKGKRELAIDIS
jgi:hypothetical protein